MEILVPEDRISFARFKSHFTPPPGSVLKPLAGAYISFEDFEGKRAESVNCLRILCRERGITEEAAAAHAWGQTCGKPEYMGFHQTVIGRVEGLHAACSITDVRLKVEWREENSNRAHCDLVMLSEPTAKRNDRTTLRLAVSRLFEENWTADPASS